MVIKDNGPPSLYATPGNAADRNVPSAERDGAFVPVADEHGYKIVEQPMGTKRSIRVILMGAGASTLNFLKKAEEQLENVRITVYEKNSDVGGTWLVGLPHLRQLFVCGSRMLIILAGKSVGSIPFTHSVARTRVIRSL